jgi:pyroglutamyl-peptidase
MARPRVLVTGFGPFPGVPENPSAWLAATLAERGLPNLGGELHLRVLPTEWRIVDLLPQLYETLQPHVMIHFGVDQRAKTLRIERCAQNCTSRREDAAGALPGCSAIAPEGVERHVTKVPAAKLAAHLRSRGFQAVASRSAGNYLCNFLYYHSLDWARGRDCLALFVHIPPLRGAGSLREEGLLLGAQEILRFVLDVARGRERGPRREVAKLGAELSRKEA